MQGKLSVRSEGKALTTNPRTTPPNFCCKEVVQRNEISSFRWKMVPAWPFTVSRYMLTLHQPPLLAALFQQFQFLSLLCLLHTHTRLHKWLGFNLQQVPQTAQTKKKKKKKIRKISVKAKLEMSKVEYVYSYLDALNKKRQRMNLMLWWMLATFEGKRAE